MIARHKHKKAASKACKISAVIVARRPSVVCGISRRSWNAVGKSFFLSLPLLKHPEGNIQKIQKKNPQKQPSKNGKICTRRAHAKCRKCRVREAMFVFLCVKGGGEGKQKSFELAFGSTINGTIQLNVKRFLALLAADNLPSFAFFDWIGLGTFS